jgi:hypothetical protein
MEITIPSSLDEALQAVRFKSTVARVSLEDWLNGMDAQYVHKSGRHMKTILAQVYKAIDHHKDASVREHYWIHA